MKTLNSFIFAGALAINGCAHSGNTEVKQPKTEISKKTTNESKEDDQIYLPQSSFNYDQDRENKNEEELQKYQEQLYECNQARSAARKVDYQDNELSTFDCSHINVIKNTFKKVVDICGNVYHPKTLSDNNPIYFNSDPSKNFTEQQEWEARVLSNKVKVILQEIATARPD
ncbi:hypothetical protein GF376_04490, partial [Candidatus Peregrinibacteria bacterium]|nr:hypothetical protein [Candidatus Peregrinibacteria bacterium]